MSRRTSLHTVTTDGRDKGKVFTLTEMSALQAERWALRVFFALANAGAEIPEVQGAGMAKLREMGAAALTGLGMVPFEVAEPLLDEMLGCVALQHNGNSVTMDFAKTHGMELVEEVETLFKLRLAVLELHMGFSMADATQRPAAAPVSPASSIT